jgi:hypothetical protein
MFGAFNVDHFPFVYIRIKSEDHTDETFEYYKSSIIQVLYKAKMEKQKVIILLDLFQSDGSKFNVDNLFKQANFYKRIMEYSTKYVQHLYILSHRNDLPIYVKIFKTFCKALVPFKIVKTLEKVEKNILKKYGEKVSLSMFENPANLRYTELYVSDVGSAGESDDLFKVVQIPPSPSSGKQLTPEECKKMIQEGSSKMDNGEGDESDGEEPEASA